jgi:hypothetical protein
MKKLDNITLISIDDVNPEYELKAIMYCMQYFEFTTINLLHLPRCMS